MTDFSTPSDQAPVGAPPQQGWQAPQGSYPQYGGYPQNGGFQPAAVGFTVGGAPVSSAGKRFGAYLLDSLLAIITLGIGWLIWSMIVWSKGTTPGKELLGMRCVRTDTGQAASWGTMAVRELVGKSLLGAISFGITSLVSCFMILGAARQGVWDKVATTTVVDDPAGRLLHR